MRARDRSRIGHKLDCQLKEGLTDLGRIADADIGHVWLVYEESLYRSLLSPASEIVPPEQRDPKAQAFCCRLSWQPLPFSFPICGAGDLSAAFSLRKNGRGVRVHAPLAMVARWRTPCILYQELAAISGRPLR